MGDRVELEVFVIDASGAIIAGPDGDDPDRDDAERAHLAGQVWHGCQVALEHAREIHATPGPRPGAVAATTSTRRGGDCDVVRSMRIDPWTASAIAGSPRFRGGEHRLLTFLQSEPGDDRALSWSVLVGAPTMRAVPATLHLRAAPSMVLSVLELTPRRRLRWRRSAFIGAGVEAVEALAHEFEEHHTA